MKRSHINAKIRDAEAFFAEYRFALPPWSAWAPEDWHAHRDVATEVIDAMLGWDLTDFGRGEYEQFGLLLFTVRNGRFERPREKPYAEKLMIVGDRQETPWHFHWHKTEDIINRGGGTLVIEVQLADRATEQPTADPFEVSLDGLARGVTAGQRVALAPGESITLVPWVYHRFWAEGGRCLVGEVSSVNDDANDNRFLEAIGRFPTVEEDAPPYRYLVSDYAHALR